MVYDILTDENIEYHTKQDYLEQLADNTAETMKESGLYDRHDSDEKIDTILDNSVYIIDERKSDCFANIIKPLEYDFLLKGLPIRIRFYTHNIKRDLFNKKIPNEFQQSLMDHEFAHAANHYINGFDTEKDAYKIQSELADFRKKDSDVWDIMKTYSSIEFKIENLTYKTNEVIRKMLGMSHNE